MLPSSTKISVSKLKSVLKSITFVTLSIVFIQNTLAQQNTDYLSDPEHQFWHDNATLSELTLSFSQQAWTDLQTSTQSSRVEVSANMTFVNYATAYELVNIGVKLSGNTSFVLPVNEQGEIVQANYTLDFDEFVDNQELKGITSLKLKRFNGDPSFIREPLSNKIMQSFGIFTAHSSSYVKVFLQVEEQSTQYVGVYRLNESVNRQEYIDKRFAIDNDSGYLWQGNYKAYGPALFSRINSEWEGVADADDASFEYKGKGVKFNEAKAQLVRLATNLSTLEGVAFKDYVNQHINVPLFLKFLAAEAVLGHWDGFWGNANNYMFYVDEQEVIHFIPFDTDNTLGTSAIVRDSGEQSTVQFGVSNNTPMLITKVLAIDDFLGEFLRNTQALVSEQYLMTEADSVAFILQVHELIKNDLQNVTAQHEIIEDKPASWGNQSEYRVFELNSGKNWYTTKQAAVIRNLGLPNANAGTDITNPEGTTIKLDATGSSDPDGTIVSYEWSNGLTGATPELSLSALGTQTITLTVTDNFGFIDRSTVSITTTPDLPSPPQTELRQANSGGAFGWMSLTALIICMFLRINKQDWRNI